MNPGDVFGHYRIVEPLGKGGMGEVFVAEDTRLHRRVALKVLPPIVAADPMHRERFEREARAVAALNHPNIVTLHSVEELDGRLFLTMELVDGKPLGEIIPRGGLPLDRILRIGIEVADAMAAAQQQGITHRDLKPANIIIASSGRATVLDFGLAKLKDAEAVPADDLTRMSPGGGDLTGEGKIVGTVAYMSPEQAEGKPVDPRSDIFSLGVALHEMATGEKPFKGDTETLSLDGARLAELDGLASIPSFLPDGGLMVQQRSQGKAVIAIRPAKEKTFRPITPPSGEFILGGAVSKDGRVAFARGTQVSDVVLIKAK